MEANLTISVILLIILVVGILYNELDRKEKEIRALESKIMQLKAKNRLGEVE